MVAILFSNTSNAVTWQEQGDAGELLSSAQSLTGRDDIEAINGNISTSYDVDMYKIKISNPTSFSAVLTGGEGDNNWDSMLWLFDENGLGVYANDDAHTGNGSSTLPFGSSLSPKLFGEYFLAISDDDIDPYSGSSISDLIFAASGYPYTEIIAPTGSGGSSSLSGWIPDSTVEKSFNNANYSIALTGATLVPTPDMVIEDQIAFIERFYQNILGRASDEEGLKYWLNVLQTDSGATVAFGFFNSNEFIALNLDNPDFVDILYQTMFGRNQDEEGAKFWIPKLDSGESRDSIIYGFVSSLEFEILANGFNVTPISDADARPFLINDFVQRFYQLVLNREPDIDGNNYWTSKLLDGEETGGNIARGFFESSEFIDRLTTDGEFIDIAYQAFFGRGPDSGGQQYWLGQLSAGVAREEVISGFINSQEFIDLADRFGIKAN
jgi:hypothetical protein